jgi:hypothetical protein
MKLPAEIRLKILRELLWHPEPLKALRETSEPANNVRPWSRPVELQSWDGEITGTNYTLYPEILAVCRKLNEEGGPVLYGENTVDVVTCYHPVDSYRPGLEWMGHSSSLASISESLSARARKLRITVKRSGSRTTRTLVRQLVDVLRANPQWCSLDVRLEDNPMLYRFFSTEEDEICLNEKILRPLYLLRRLQHIEVTGVSPQFAAELSELAKSDRPIIELEKMFDSLTGYAYGSVGGGIRSREVFSEEDMKLAENAIEAGNVTEFYKYRDRVIWDVEKFLRKRRAGAFKNDPDPICSRLSNLEFIAEQDRLENLETEKELVETL